MITPLQAMLTYSYNTPQLSPRYGDPKHARIEENIPVLNKLVGNIKEKSSWMIEKSSWPKADLDTLNEWHKDAGYVNCPIDAYQRVMEYLFEGEKGYSTYMFDSLLQRHTSKEYAPLMVDIITSKGLTYCRPDDERLPIVIAAQTCATDVVKELTARGQTCAINEVFLSNHTKNLCRIAGTTEALIKANGAVEESDFKQMFGLADTLTVKLAQPYKLDDKDALEEREFFKVALSNTKEAAFAIKKALTLNDWAEKVSHKIHFFK